MFDIIKSFKLFKTLNKLYNSRENGIRILLYNVFSNVLTLILNLALPFITNENEYGYFVLVYSIVNFGSSFFTLGFNSTVLKYSIDNSLGDKILITSLLCWLLISLPILALSISILTIIEIESIIKISSYHFILSLVASFFISFSRVGLYFYLGLKRIHHYGALLVLNKLIQFLFVGYVIIFSKINFIEILPYAFVLQGIVIFLSFIVYEYKLFLTRHINLSLIKKMIKITLPLSLNSFSTIGSGYGFNIIISPLLSLTQLGVFNIVSQFANMYNLIINALSDGFIPKFHTDYIKSSKESIKSYSKYIFFNSIFIATTIIPFAIVYMYTLSNFFVTVNIIFVLIYFIANFVNSFKSIGLNIFLLKEKTNLIFYINTLYSIINITLSFWLTSLIGLSGTFLALSISILIHVYILNTMSNR